MTQTRLIQTLSLDEVRELLLGALRTEAPVRALNSLLASIDWSTANGEIPDDVAGMLAEAEGLTTEFSEGELTFPELERSITRLASTWLQSGWENQASAVTVRVSFTPPVRTEHIKIDLVPA